MLVCFGRGGILWNWTPGDYSSDNGNDNDNDIGNGNGNDNGNDKM